MNAVLPPVTQLTATTLVTLQLCGECRMPPYPTATLRLSYSTPTYRRSSNPSLGLVPTSMSPGFGAGYKHLLIALADTFLFSSVQFFLELTALCPVPYRHIFAECLNGFSTLSRIFLDSSCLSAVCIPYHHRILPSRLSSAVLL